MKDVKFQRNFFFWLDFDHLVKMYLGRVNGSPSWQQRGRWQENSQNRQKVHSQRDMNGQNTNSELNSEISPFAGGCEGGLCVESVERQRAWLLQLLAAGATELKPQWNEATSPRPLGPRVNFFSRCDLWTQARVVVRCTSCTSTSGAASLCSAAVSVLEKINK